MSKKNRSKIYNYCHNLCLFLALFLITNILSSCTEKKLRDILNISAKPQDEFTTFSYPSLTVPKIFDLPSPTDQNDTDNSSNLNGCKKGINIRDRNNAGINSNDKSLTNADSALLNASHKSGAVN